MGDGRHSASRLRRGILALPVAAGAAAMVPRWLWAAVPRQGGVPSGRIIHEGRSRYNTRGGPGAALQRRNGMLAYGLALDDPPAPWRIACRRRVVPAEGRKRAGRARRPNEAPVRIAEVEDRGFEPLTFWLPARRSPN